MTSLVRASITFYTEYRKSDICCFRCHSEPLRKFLTLIVIKTECSCSCTDRFAVAPSGKVEGTIRGCVTYGEEECIDLNDESLPGTSYTNAHGKACICKTDLCNSAPQTSVGRMAVIFTVVSFLALAAGRSLSKWWCKQQLEKLLMLALFRHVLLFAVVIIDSRNCLCNAMHGQNINLPVCVCPSHFLSTRLHVRPLNGFLQLIP